MHSFVVGLLTVLLVLDCIFLILLVLLQLPKKEAGAGVAFGGAAADALFGAGSGNVLTKITKYVAGMFFVIALVLTIIGTPKTNNVSLLQQELLKKGAAPATAPASSNAPLKVTPEPTKAPAQAESTNK